MLLVNNMSVVQGVLNEEINRLKSNIVSYEQMLLSLPRGTIFIRKVGNSLFVYRKRKENGKVLSEYIGSFNSENTKKEIEKSKDYKRIKNNIRIAKKELVKLERAVNVYGRDKS